MYALHDEPDRRYTMRAPNIPETAKVAREMVSGLLSATGHCSLIDPARLLVSELVSNVHLHTKVPLLMLEATVRAGQLHVSVRDEEPTRMPDTTTRPTPHAEHGRGLLLVQAYADAWGTIWHGGLHPRGKSVWFELADQPRSPSGGSGA
ncbi:ATP-binding protein [Streptomyces hygroscopicus]|uniref:ATP-binding protein n=1 Tax=Streptomyces hygroscopicus TaxID=1912 RepID=UPI0036B3972B